MKNIADTEALQIRAAETLLSSLPGWQDVNKDHRAETPKRFVKALMQMCDPASEWFEFTTFPATNHNMVTLGPIPFYTLCAHHVVPFHGDVWISYVPNERLAGLSKFARQVKLSAKGLWVQEELTAAIATDLEDHLRPLGVGVVIEAEHMCMAMRGVQQPGVITTTAEMTGVYADHSRTAKSEFLQYIALHHKS